jgi:hypothetical protein
MQLNIDLDRAAELVHLGYKQLDEYPIAVRATIGTRAKKLAEKLNPPPPEPPPIPKKAAPRTIRKPKTKEA